MATLRERAAKIRAQLDAVLPDLAKFLEDVEHAAAVFAGDDTHKLLDAAPQPVNPIHPAATHTARAVDRVLNMLHYGAIQAGARANDGRLVFTQYGGPSDRTPDANTKRQLGNRGNALGPDSLSLSPDLIGNYRLKGGERISVIIGAGAFDLGVYDDTTGDHTRPNTIDVYDPFDTMGHDDFLAFAPAGQWALLVNGNKVIRPLVVNGSPEHLVDAARHLPVPFPYAPDASGGRLGCADVVSTALKVAGLIDHIVLSVDQLAQEMMQQHGWSELEHSKDIPDGALIIFEATPDTNGHKHIGIAAHQDGVQTCINNKSSLAKVVEEPLASMNRPIEKVLVPPKGI